MQPTPKFRYYDAVAYKRAQRGRSTAYTDFLRTGKLDRREWSEAEKRYLTYREVAEMTGRKLEQAGSVTHERINGFHLAVEFFFGSCVQQHRHPFPAGQRKIVSALGTDLALLEQFFIENDLIAFFAFGPKSVRHILLF